MSQYEDQVCSKIQTRADFGLKKYGIGMNRSDFSIQQWLNHLQEELMDAAIYAERIMSFNEPTTEQVIVLLELLNNKLNADEFYDRLSPEQLVAIRLIASNILNIIPENATDENDLLEQQMPIEDTLQTDE